MAPRGSDRCYWKPSIGVGDCQVVGTPAWTNPPTQSTSTTYDARNSRVQQVDGLTNGITTYDPDHNYQPRAVYLPTGSGRELQSLFTYDTRHRLDLVTHQLCVLSGAGHACSSTSPAGSDDYAYDDNDNRTAVLESNGSASSDHRYCYDALDHLRARNTAVACTTTSGDETYTYDDAGNRLTAPGDTFTYSPDGQLCQVDLAGPCPADPTTWQIRYDTAGRTSSYSGWTFAYDSAGRMTSACQSPTCAAGFDRVEFAYDGEGHRTRITETSAAGAVTTTDFRYQGDAVVQEVSGSITRDFVLDDQGTARKLTITGGTDAGTYVVVWNGHGDATGLWRVNADGTLTLANSFTYDTWGRPTLGTHNGIGDLGFRYRYVGASDVQWDDAFGLGLAYMHARHYSPALGRFLQPDPEAAEDNLFGYAGNSPVTKADPSGRIAFCAMPFVGWVICANAVRTIATGLLGWLATRGPAVVSKAPAIVNAVKDNLGRIGTVTSTLTRANIGAGTRVTDAARRICCAGLKGYDAGHLIAKILGGPGGAQADNVVAVLSRVNRGTLRIYEGEIRRWIEKGYRVDIRIRLVYNGSDKVPASIEYSYRLNTFRARWITQEFINK